MEPLEPDQNSSSPPQGRVVLGTSCTIHEVAAIKAHMIEQLSRSAPYALDGAAVERIDAAGVQLIVAFALDCLERNVGFLWTGRSPALEHAVSLMAVESLLESPGVATTGAAG